MAALPMPISRANPLADHLAFNWGGRSCVGAGLARAEMRETMITVM